MWKGGREGERERLREGDFYWFTTQMVSAAEPALDQSQVPGTVSVQFHPLDGREPSTWTTFLCFYRCISREVEQLGQDLALLWDAGMAGGGLT